VFDLELAIQKWKEEFRDIDSLRKDDVVELESHLRELVAKLSRGELNENEAFLVATRRLGKSAELNKEFAKVHGTTIWRKRIFWMLCGYFLYSLGSTWVGALASCTGAGIAATGMEGTTVGAVSVTMWAIGWTALLAFSYHKSKSSVPSCDRIPFSWICIGGLTMAIGLVLNQAGTIVQMNYLGADGFGIMSSWRIIGIMVVKVCVLVAGITLICTLSEPKTDAMETAT
jgi:hypothetical protein